MGISRKPARGGHESLRGSPPTTYTENFSQKVETDNNRNVSNLSTQQKQYSFSGLCGGRNHLKCRGLAACRGPSASSYFLGCAPHFSGYPPRCPRRRGETRPEFPSPGFLHFNAPGRGAEEPPRAQLSEPRQAREGYGEGSSARPAPPSPMRQSAASLRRDAHISLGVEGVGGATPTFEGFFPHILYQRIQLKLQTDSD